MLEAGEFYELEYKGKKGVAIVQRINEDSVCFITLEGEIINTIIDEAGVSFSVKPVQEL